MRPGQGFSIDSLDAAYRFGQYVAKSAFYKALTQPEQVVVTLQLANDCGVPFSLVATNIAFINGRASVYGDGLIGIAYASGLVEDFEETCQGDGENAVATCRVKRKGIKSDCSRSFSWQDAKQAGLTNRDPWKNYPKRMLQMRARSWALRDAGLIGGIIAREEAEDIPSAAVPQPIADGTHAFALPPTLAEHRRAVEPEEDGPTVAPVDAVEPPEPAEVPEVVDVSPPVVPEPQTAAQEPEEKPVLKCPICQKPYIQAKSLANHIQAEHSPPELASDPLERATPDPTPEPEPAASEPFENANKFQFPTANGENCPHCGDGLGEANGVGKRQCLGCGVWCNPAVSEDENER